MATLVAGYAALGSALSGNTLTELSGSGYARQALTLSYDPVLGVITTNTGVTFGPATGTLSPSYMAIYDAITGGNLLLVWPIAAVSIASGTDYTVPAGLTITGVTFGRAPSSVAANAAVGTISNPSGTTGGATGATVQSGVALALSAANALTAGTPAAATVALTDGASIATDCSKGTNFSVTLAGNRTLATPTNATVGSVYRWYFTQDGTGSRTLTLGAGFKTAGGAPTLTTAANAIDRYTAAYDGTTFFGVIEKAFA